jgi:ATP-dependent Lon protease
MMLRQKRNRLRKNELPLVPLRELVIFPSMVTPFFAGREVTIKAIEEAMGSDRRVFLGCQKNESETPEQEDLYEAGTVGRVLQMLKLPDGTVRVLAEGMERAKLLRTAKRQTHLHAQYETIANNFEVTPPISALMKTVQNGFLTYAKNHKKITKESITAVEQAEFPNKLIDLIAAQVSFKTEEKIKLLRIEDTYDRLEKIAILLESENEVAAMQNRIHNQVKERIEKGQKEYFLTEQLREINKELGRSDEDPTGSKELEKKLFQRELPEEVQAKAKKELGRLSKLGPMSPEAGVLRTYLEWINDLPWAEKTVDNKDIDKAEKILNEDHYNLKKAKERILDFIAVTQLKEKLKGPILCFVGPPGTGKTSLGKSVARALGRSFIRISLGGVKDEAEIRGHRKTYVGALPGKIIQGMKKAETVNPVFLLDEVDKISTDFRGDPASALLEVLDPEQNNSFLDHYLEIPYDLSNILFITTANSVHTIPLPLQDRMEIIELSGYTDFEKEKIAADFIIPKQLEENGLAWANIKFQKQAILEVIRNYTMESGVRNLERQIATIIRKLARDAVKQGYSVPAAATEEEGQSRPEGPVPAVVEEGQQPAEEEKAEGAKTTFTRVVTPKGLHKYLGNPRYAEKKVVKEARPGLAYGLAWTEMGGTLLPVEVALLEGKGELILTGNLGDVMKESGRTALSFIQAHYRSFKLTLDALQKTDIHIHVPEGAIPKDGPSAGITLTAAILSAFTGKSLRQPIAMTGEVTLTGRLLPVGGIKEKVLAAYRHSISRVLLPEENRKDTSELPKEVTSSIDFIFTGSVKEALTVLFAPQDRG